jgi:colanic acid/amylovoran biosynthesis glycosyltransferase
MSASCSPKLVVAHILKSYLFLTGSWIYHQIASMSRYRPVVLCRTTQNLDLFPVKTLYSLQSGSPIGYAVNRVLRELIGYDVLFRPIMHREHPKLIHAHFGHMGYYALPLARARGIPLVVTFYGYDLSRTPHQQSRWRRRYQRLFVQGTLFTVEGNFMRQQLVELGCPPEKAVVQHLGVDLRQLAFRARQIGSEGLVRVLVSGTFTEKKGIPYAVEAFARVRQVHDYVRLTLVGDARKFPEEQAIKQQIYDIVRRYQVEDSVAFLGYQPYPGFLELLYQHDILLSPSVQARSGDNEGGAPVTIIEASATGMPVLATTHCDIPEVILDGESGFLVEERDVEALAERLEFLTARPELWPKMGRAGRRHVEQEYDLDKQVAALEELYDRIRLVGKVD